MSRLNSFIIGTLLGDSYIQKRYTEYVRKDDSILRNGPFYNLRCEQVTLDLIQHKADIWGNVFGKDPIIYTRQRKPTIVNGGKRESVFKPSHNLVIACPGVSDYHSLFYRDGKKVVTAKTLFYLSAEGIAHWIMDDGFFSYTASNNTRRLFLCTDGFDLFSCKLICQFFSERYQISAGVQQRKSPKGNIHYRVKFGGKDIQKVAVMVFPYMLPSFYYKIFSPYDKVDSKTVIPEYREIYDTLQKNVPQRKALLCSDDIV